MPRRRLLAGPEVPSRVRCSIDMVRRGSQKLWAAGTLGKNGWCIDGEVELLVGQFESKVAVVVRSRSPPSVCDQAGGGA